MYITPLRLAYSESVSVSPPGDGRQSFCHRSAGLNFGLIQTDFKDSVSCSPYGENNSIYIYSSLHRRTVLSMHCLIFNSTGHTIKVIKCS